MKTAKKLQNPATGKKIELQKHRAAPLPPPRFQLIWRQPVE
jgi:hypothetical protein